MNVCLQIKLGERMTEDKSTPPLCSHHALLSARLLTAEFFFFKKNLLTLDRKSGRETINISFILRGFRMFPVTGISPVRHKAPVLHGTWTSGEEGDVMK